MAGIGWLGQTRVLVAGLVVALGLTFAGADGARAMGAHASIVGGESTTIAKWPWQVAFVQSKSRMPGMKPSRRFFCGGTLVAPTVVLTANHCANALTWLKPRDLAVIGGRTNLNRESQGLEVAIKDFVLPLNARGLPRDFDRDPRWDIALLELAEPMGMPPIELLGADEMTLAQPGRVIAKTGWGMGSPTGEGLPRTVLREQTVAIQPPRACILSFGSFPGGFDPDTHLCIADPEAQSMPCIGDSGGPATIETSEGPRLVGITSMRPAKPCRPSSTAIDANLASPKTTNWVRRIVLERTGVDPVGSGATADPVARYCLVPRVVGLKVAAARNLVRTRACEPRISRAAVKSSRKYRRLNGTVISARHDPPFVLRVPGHKVDMVVARWKPGKR